MNDAAAAFAEFLKSFPLIENGLGHAPELAQDTLDLTFSKLGPIPQAVPDGLQFLQNLPILVFGLFEYLARASLSVGESDYRHAGPLLEWSPSWEPNKKKRPRTFRSRAALECRLMIKLYLKASPMSSFAF